jgi:hypothetical protein
VPKKQPKVPVPESVRLYGPFFADTLWAFEKFNCDPENLADWQKMLWFYAIDLKRRAGGRRQTWDLTKLFTVRAAVEEMQRIDPAKTGRKCCEELSKHHAWRSEGFSIEVLERRLSEARKPAHAERYKAFKGWLRDYVQPR